MKERRTSLRRGSSHVFTERGEKSTRIITGEQQNIKQVTEKQGLGVERGSAGYVRYIRYVIIYISELDEPNQIEHIPFEWPQTRELQLLSKTNWNKIQLKLDLYKGWNGKTNRDSTFFRPEQAQRFAGQSRLQRVGISLSLNCQK